MTHNTGINWTRLVELSENDWITPAPWRVGDGDATKDWLVANFHFSPELNRNVWIQTDQVPASDIHNNHTAENDAEAVVILRNKLPEILEMYHAAKAFVRPMVPTGEDWDRLERALSALDDREWNEWPERQSQGAGR